MKKIFFLAIVTLLFSVSCKSSKVIKTAKNSMAEQQYTLNKNIKWVLTSFNGKTPKDAGFKDRIPFLKIYPEKGSISGNSGCNAFNGPVNIEGSKIKIGLLAATKAFCMNVREQDFFNYLNDADNFSIKNDKLLLMKGKEILMEFIAQPEE